MQRAADVNGDGGIDSADVTLILRLAVGLPVNPPASSSKEMLTSETSHAAKSMQVWIPSQSASGGSSITIPVYASDLANVAGSKLQVNFDPAVLQAQDATAGPALVGSTLSYKTLTGAIVLSFSNTRTASSGQCVLANLKFKVIGKAGQKSYLTLSTCKLTGAYGESLGWNNTITLSRGLFTILGASVGPAWVDYP